MHLGRITSLDLTEQRMEAKNVKKTSMIICTLVLTMLLVPVYSSAVDFGFYLDLGRGSGEAEFDYSYSPAFDIDTDFFGVGFQFETNPLTPKKVFSYRFQAGFESRGIEDEFGTKIDLGGIVINNTFAFGGTTAEKIRLWGGPQVMVGYYSGDTNESYMGDTQSFTGFGFGLGVAGGANFGLGKGNTMLTTTLGLRSLGFAGEMEWLNESETLRGNATEVYFSIGMLF